MARAADMAERLPTLYRDGELMRGLLGVLGLQLEVIDEESREVARAHAFDTCLELEEAAGLAAVLDIPPEPWQSLAEYRPWVHALRDARLRAGSVTPEGIRLFVDHYAARFQAVHRVRITPGIPQFSRQPEPDTPALIENPPRLRMHRVPPQDGIEPLARAEAVNRGLDPVTLAAVFTGLGATGPEYAPLLANLTTGEALVYLGPVPPGSRLWLLPSAPGLDEDGDAPALSARLEAEDVTAHARKISGFAPGPTGPPAPEVGPPSALTLARGMNELWFLPLAHFDVPGLDRVLLALAELSLRQGRWDETEFEHALFAQEPAATLQLAWVETTPASFLVDLPAGSLRNRAGELADAIAARDRLQAALAQALPTLAAAGIRAEVRFRPHREHQPSRDHMSGMLPRTYTEMGSTGADQLPDSGGSFGVTGFDDSTYR
jgi:hypothetical protein